MRFKVCLFICAENTQTVGFAASVPCLTSRCPPSKFALSVLEVCGRRRDSLACSAAPHPNAVPVPMIHCARSFIMLQATLCECPSVTDLRRASPTSRLRRQLWPCGSFLAERCFRRGRRLPRPSPASGQPRLPQCCTQRTSSIVRGWVGRSSDRIADLHALRCASTAGMRRSSTTSCGSPTSPRLHP